MRARRPFALRDLPVALGVFLLLVLAAAILADWLDGDPAYGQQLRHGTGFSDSLQPGVRSCLYTSWPDYRAKRGCISFVMDLTAQPFNPRRPQDAAAMARRYGQAPGSVTPDGQGTWLVSCDAESIQQGCARWLEERCRNSPAAQQYDCSLDWNGDEGWRAARDEYDFFAVNSGGMPNPGGGTTSKPGQPRIEAAVAVAPGQAGVRWVGKVSTAFEVVVGPARRQVPGDVFSTIVELQPGVGGDLPVTVTAFKDSVPGAPSLVRMVHVEPAGEPLPLPTPFPTATPQPTAEPQPTATPCSPVVKGEPMPAEVRGTLDEALGRLGRKWAPQRDAARAWLDAHDVYVPGIPSSGLLGMSIDGPCVLRGDFWRCGDDLIPYAAMRSPAHESRGCLP